MNRQPQKNAPQGGIGPRRGPGPQMIREKPKNTKKTLGRLIKYIGSNKYLLFALMGIVLIVTGLSLASPAIQALIINNLTNGKGNIDFTALYKLLTVLASIYVLNAVCSYLQGLFAAKLSASTVLKMRNDLFARMVKLPMSFIDSHQHGDIMSRMTNDVENISNTVSQSISSLFSSALTLVGSFVLMLCYSWQLTLVALITIPLTVLLSTRFAKVMRKLFVKQQKTLGELNGQIEETVTGYETIVAYSRENSEIDKFYDISTKLKKVAVKAQACGSIMGPLMNVIGNLGFILISAFG
ncbi:MAG: ABC transporter ATP-binding protein, partial [Oscillospiraceae bacterium]|nr:ABC transporter ATP-binding protein [Oscillospiraceae bacterium]